MRCSITEQSANLFNDNKEIRFVHRDNIRLCIHVFVMWKVGERWEVGRSVIPENQRIVTSLIVIGIGVPLDLLLNFDKLPEVKNTSIQKEDLAPDETNIGTALVVAYLPRVCHIQTNEEIV